MLHLIFLIFWVAFSVAVAIRAKTRNRWPFGWFLLSILFSPVLAIVLLVILPPRPTPEELYWEWQHWRATRLPRTVEQRTVAVVVGVVLATTAAIGLLGLFVGFIALLSV